MGVPAFYSPVGINTIIEDGGVPVKYTKDNKGIELVSDAKERRQFHDRNCVLERTILSDYAFVKAWKADHKGNCIFKKCGINFNADIASAGKICIVEADEIVQTGTIDGEDVELAGIFVHRVVKSQKQPEPMVKRISEEELMESGATKTKRELILKRAAREIKDGMYVYITNGYPKLTRKYLRKDITVDFVSAAGVHGIEPAINSMDPYIIDSDYTFSSLKKGSTVTKASDTFAALRGDRLSLLITEGFQVSEKGELANLSKTQDIMGYQSNFDITSTNTPLVVLMEHKNAQGKSNIVKECTLPVSGKNCISKLITDMAVFEFRGDKMVLIEKAPDVSVDDIRKATDASFEVEKDFKNMILQ